MANSRPSQRLIRPWQAIYVAVVPIPVSALPSLMRLKPLPKDKTMLPNIDYSELPRALQHILNRDNPDVPATPSRRSFLKMAGISGFALGAFPGMVLAQSTNAAKPLGPTQQPSAFVEIAADGTVTVTINRLDFGQAVQTSMPTGPRSIASMEIATAPMWIR